MCANKIAPMKLFYLKNNSIFDGHSVYKLSDVRWNNIARFLCKLIDFTKQFFCVVEKLKKFQFALLSREENSI